MGNCFFLLGEWGLVGAVHVKREETRGGNKKESQR